MIWRNLAVGAAVALTLVGCGDPLADKLESSGKQAYSDDDPSILGEGAPTEPGSPATQEFIRQANEICAYVNASTPVSIPDDPAEIQASYEQALAGSRAGLDRLRQLTPPPGDEVKIAHVLDEQEAVLGVIQEAVDAGRLTDEGSIQAFNAELEPRSDALDEAYRDYGLADCD